MFYNQLTLIIRDKIKISFYRPHNSIVLRRLDFDSFSITGPSSSSALVGNLFDSKTSYSTRGVCDTDSLSLIHISEPTRQAESRMPSSA